MSFYNKIFNVLPHFEKTTTTTKKTFIHLMEYTNGKKVIFTFLIHMGRYYLV